MPDRKRRGRALVLVGMLAVVCALRSGRGAVAPEEAGDAVNLCPGALQGRAFRLLPGVGPVLADRLEAARRAAGGVLGPEQVAAVRGVGPARMALWASLWAGCEGPGGVADHGGVR